MPTFQRWDRVGRSLRCALEQNGVDVEVVIVSDGERRMPEDMLPPDERRVRVIYPPEPRGVAYARNLGIQEAGAQWVAFLDDDDLWAPDKLGRQLAAARETGAGWVFASALAVDDGMRPLELFRAPTSDGLLAALFEFQRIPAGCSSVMARTELLRSVGGFDETLHQLADWDLWIRLAEAAPGAPVDEVMVGYVQHPGSMLLTHDEWVFTEFNRFRDKHRKLGGAVAGQMINAEGFAFWIVRRLEEAGLRRRAIKVSLYAAIRYRDLGLLANAARLILHMPPPEHLPEPPPSEPPAWLRAHATV
jgi:glycosyltransferase involved in cell wall biosynthesis